MGIKRRIMTSGQKFIRKHRGWLDIVGAGADDDVVDAVPGMSVFVSAVSATVYSNQLVEINALMEGAIAADSAVTVKDGSAACAAITMAAGANKQHNQTGPFTVDDITVAKANIARYDIPGAGAHGTRRPVLNADDTVRVFTPGEHTVTITPPSGDAQFAKSVTFSVVTSNVTVTEPGEDLLVQGAAPDNLKIDLAKLNFDGFQPGVHLAYDPDVNGAKHGFKIELFKQVNSAGDFVTARTAGGFWTTPATGVALHNNTVGKDFTAALENVLHADSLVADGAKATFKLKFTPLDSANNPITANAFESSTHEIDRTA